MFIYLDIVENFSCEMCGRCCRNNWQVTVGEASFERNAGYFGKLGRTAEFRQAFKPLVGNTAPGEFAYIEKNAKGHCWFLNESGLCRLHREAGHEHLDDVCQIYPRYPMDTARGVELTLSFSCPAVLNLASRVEPLRIVRSERLPLIVGPDSYVTTVYPSQQPVDTPLRHYFELEQHLIDIIQWRGLTVAERLGVVADTVKAVSGAAGEVAFTENLNRIFYANYDLLDSRPESVDQPPDMPDIISENFLMNLVFKKVFYRYGLRQGLHLLESAWRRIADACFPVQGQAAPIDLTREVIMSLELEYSHGKKR